MLLIYWYQLLKLVQTYGTIEKFDLIFHRSGPLIGQPRGYAFVTYAKSQDALKAKNSLNGKLVGQKNLTVTWAHSAEYVSIICSIIYTLHPFFVDIGSWYSSKTKIGYRHPSPSSNQRYQKG